MSAERRQHERFELLVEVALPQGDQRETLTVLNISAGGVLLRNDRAIAFASGEQIRVEFDVPELAPAFAIDARVIRVIQPTAKAAALAAMWTSSDPAATAALGELLWSLSKSR
jgi:hypothetical protein